MSAYTSEPARFDAIIVGAGVGGLYAIHRLRKLGLKVHAFEAGGGVGGTWYWNRYPGCRCDVESMEYSYSFSDELQLEWRWPERYGTQPEILRYINHVARRGRMPRTLGFSTTTRSRIVRSIRWQTHGTSAPIFQGNPVYSCRMSVVSPHTRRNATRSRPGAMRAFV